MDWPTTLVVLGMLLVAGLAFHGVLGIVSRLIDHNPQGRRGNVAAHVLLIGVLTLLIALFFHERALAIVVEIMKAASGG